MIRGRPTQAAVCFKLISNPSSSFKFDPIETRRSCRMSSDKKDDGAGVPMSPDVEEDESTGYKPPAEKSLAEIVNADAEDESLVR